MCICFITLIGGKDEDDGEPDKMAIAFGRFGTLNRFIKSSIASCFRGIKNKIVGAIRGGHHRENDIALEAADERDFQVSYHLSSARKMYNFIPSP